MTQETSMLGPDFHHTQRSVFFRSEPLLSVISLIQQPKLYGNILSLRLRAVLSVPSNRVSKKPGAEQSFWEGRGESVMEQTCHRATGSGGKPGRRRRRCKGTTWMSTTSCSPASLPPAFQGPHVTAPQASLFFHTLVAEIPR